MNLKNEKIVFYSLLVISFILVLWIDLTANATFDPGDGLQHYLISHFSWKHPHLFLDLWGKPFFTLISSPFTQFGYNGMILFQALNAVTVSFFTYKIANKINIKYAWIAPILIFFSPIYFAVINTGLTEIFFGSMFMLSVWLLVEKKFLLSAIFASFIPFVRPEGYLVLILLFLVLFIRKRYFEIPFLIGATLLYTFIGYFYYHDIFWIITNNYAIEENYPGMKGEYLHYINHYDQIWGKPYAVLLLVGVCTIIYSVYQLLTRKTKSPYLPEEVFLILGSFFGCLVLHSLLYSFPGVLNNLGMIRYMAVLIPSSAILALKGVNLISFFDAKKYLYPRRILLVVLIYLIVKSPFKQWYYPFHLNNEETVIKEAGKWLSASKLNNEKIFFLHPYLAVAADLDPFDKTKTTLLWSLDKVQLNSLPDSSVLFWDSHFAPQEGKIQLSDLMSVKGLMPLKHYKYFNENMPFEVWIFLKINSDQQTFQSITAEIIYDRALLSNLNNSGSILSTQNLNRVLLLTEKKIFSNKSVLEVNPENIYSPVISKVIKEIDISNEFNMLEVDFRFSPLDSIKDILPVFEIKDGDKTIVWYAKNINWPIKYNDWNSIKLTQYFPPETLKENYILNFYFWNKGKRKFYVDDVVVNYYEVKK